MWKIPKTCQRLMIKKEDITVKSIHDTKEASPKRAEKESSNEWY